MKTASCTHQTPAIVPAQQEATLTNPLRPPRPRSSFTTLHACLLVSGGAVFVEIARWAYLTAVNRPLSESILNYLTGCEAITITYLALRRIVSGSVVLEGLALAPVAALHRESRSSNASTVSSAIKGRLAAWARQALAPSVPSRKYFVPMVWMIMAVLVVEMLVVLVAAPGVHAQNQSILLPGNPWHVFFRTTDVIVSCAQSLVFPTIVKLYIRKTEPANPNGKISFSYLCLVGGFASWGVSHIGIPSALLICGIFMLCGILHMVVGIIWSLVKRRPFFEWCAHFDVFHIGFCALFSLSTLTPVATELGKVIVSSLGVSNVTAQLIGTTSIRVLLGTVVVLTELLSKHFLGPDGFFLSFGLRYFSEIIIMLLSVNSISTLPDLAAFAVFNVIIVFARDSGIVGDLVYLLSKQLDAFAWFVESSSASLAIQSSVPLTHETRTNPQQAPLSPFTRSDSSASNAPMLKKHSSPASTKSALLSAIPEPALSTPPPTCAAVPTPTRPVLAPSMQLNPWHIHVQFQVERFQHNVVARILTIVVFTIRLLVRIFIAAIDPTFVGLDSVMMRMQMVLGIALSTAAGQMLATWFVWRKLQTIERAGGKQVMFSEKGTRSGGKQRRRPSWWKLVTRTDLWVVEHLLLNVTGMALVVLSSDV